MATVQRGTDSANTTRGGRRQEAGRNLPRIWGGGRDGVPLAEQVWRDGNSGVTTATGIGSGECTAKTDSGAAGVGQRRAEGVSCKKMVSPPARRRRVQHLVNSQGCSERRACQLVGIARSSARYVKRAITDNEAFQNAIQVEANTHRSYGYRRVTVMLKPRAGGSITNRYSGCGNTWNCRFRKGSGINDESVRPRRRCDGRNTLGRCGRMTS